MLTILLAGILAEAMPRFEIDTGDGTLENVASINVDGLPNIVSLRQVGVPTPDWPTASCIMLANGDCVAGSFGRGSALAIEFTPCGMETAMPWKVPLTVLRAVWFVPRPGDLPRSPERYDWLPEGKHDAILTTHRDTFSGVVQGLTANPSAVRLKEKSIPLDRVACIVLDPALARLRLPKGAFYRLILRNGSRLSVASISRSDNGLSVETLFRGKATIAWNEIVELRVMQGRANYLSALKPTTVELRPYTGIRWDPQANQSVKQQPLQRERNGQIEVCDLGLGTHSGTTLNYALDGTYQRFQAGVGLDPATGRRGSVTITIRVDDKPVSLPALRKLTFADGVVDVDVDVRNAKRLTLRIDFGEGGDIQDDVNWYNARLVK